TAAFSRAPQQESYALDLGLYYLQQHAYDQAARVLERGATLNPQSPFLHLGLSLAQFLGGREAQSLESVESLLKVQPDFSPAFLLAAFVLEMNGKLKDAEKLAAQGLARPRPTAYLYYLHAAILLKLGSTDYGRILNELALAGREIPDCGLCSLTASKVHEAQGNFPAATADLEQAVRFGTDYADAWYRLASLYARVGRKADATQARLRFERLKADKEDRETAMFRKVFLQTLSGEGQSAASQRPSVCGFARSAVALVLDQRAGFQSVGYERPSWAGIALAQPPSSTTPSSGFDRIISSTSIAMRLR